MKSERPSNEINGLRNQKAQLLLIRDLIAKEKLLKYIYEWNSSNEYLASNKRHLIFPCEEDGGGGLFLIDSSKYIFSFWAIHMKFSSIFFSIFLLDIYISFKIIIILSIRNFQSK